MSRAKQRATLCEYRSKIHDLESEVGTLKTRLDELRRAKNKIINKQEPVRRTSVTRKLSVEEDERAAETITHLSNRVISLQNELELLQCKYNQDSSTLNETIKQLSFDIANLKSSHSNHIALTTETHFVDFEKIKKSHLEELALLTEKYEKGEIQRQAAEQELINYKAKVRLVSAADLNILKSELSRMREEYSKLKEDNEEEVERLEERIADLVSERSEWQAKQEEEEERRGTKEEERSTRKLVLIPDRPKTAGVRKSSPMRSSSPKASDRSVFIKTSKVMQRPKSCVERSSTDNGFQRRNVSHGNYINSERRLDRDERSDQSINSTSSITHYPSLQPKNKPPTVSDTRTVSDKWNGAVKQVDKMNKSFPSCNTKANTRVYNGGSKGLWQPQKRRARNYVQNMNL